MLQGSGFSSFRVQRSGFSDPDAVEIESWRATMGSWRGA